MSEPVTETTSIEDLKRTFNHLSFIHQKFLTVQFYLEESSQADAAMRFIAEFANKIGEQIVALTPKEEIKEIDNVQE